MAQRGDLAKRTRFKGGVDVTLRGAGSSGNDPLKVGDGTDVGCDIQIPVGQTANAFQISQPAGTVIYALGPNGGPALSYLAASGAIPVANATYLITDPGVGVFTLAAPVAGVLAGGQDGVTITLTSATAFAHTLTATGLLQTGSAAVNEATFSAFPGSSLTLRAYQGKWLVVSANAITFS